MSVVAALGAALALRAFDLEGFIFVIAVAFAVWVGGRGPGILAVLLSILVLHFVFIAPLDTGAMLPTSAYFVVFSVLAVLITALTEARHRAERSLVRARDELEVKVRQRTAALERSNRQLREEMAERQRAEDNLRTAEAELAHVGRVTTLGEVTASFAHELNQPLSAIANNANACLTALSSGASEIGDMGDALHDIVGDAERAGAIIERVRLLARRSSPEKLPLQIADVVGDVVALAANECAARRMRMLTDVPADLPTILGDRVQLQQVLLNLVVNAMDAMSDTADADRCLEIRGRHSPPDAAAAIVISVRDCGVGLPAGSGDRLFEAFHTTKPHGMGLGLAISRSLIEAHGGRLWAASNDGPGATFSFSLPTASALRAAS